MSGDFGDMSGAVGDAVTGTAAASVVEPDASAKIRDPGLSNGGACLNCGTILAGAHCHNCGQKAHVHRTLRGFLHDLVHGVLHFEGKFWRTMPLLIWRPGQLMREYIDGKRAKYVGPVALFLFTVFISFALFSISGGFGNIDPNIDTASREQLEQTLVETENEITQQKENIADGNQNGEAVGELEQELRAQIQRRDLLRQLLAADVSDNSAVDVTARNIASKPLAEQFASSGNGVGEWVNKTLQSVQSNPGLIVYKLQTNAYKLSWLLIPLSLPFVWILFPFSRRFKMYDHTVFVTYSISFMTMLAVILSVGIVFEL